MKGYDACVFPREGEPVLICLEASEEDAARTAWTTDVRFVRGYDETDPRPVPARTLDAALAASRDYGTVGLELSLGTQASDRMVGEPTTFTKAWFDAWPDARRTRCRCSTPARAIKTDAGDRAHAARERDLRRGDGARARRAAAGHEGERGRGDLAGLRARRGHGLAGQGRARARLLARLVGRRASRRSPRPATCRSQEDEPTLFEIWVCADGYWCDHTKLLCPGELRADYRELEAGPARASTSARSTTAGRARASPSSTGSCATGIDASSAIPGQPTHPICHGVGARAHEPPYAHQAGGGEIAEGMVLAIEPGCYWEGGGGLRVEDNFLITATGAEKLSPFPDGVVQCMT